jgi:hypothetical protein
MTNCGRTLDRRGCSLQSVARKSREILCAGSGMNDNNCGPGRIVCSAGNASTFPDEAGGAAERPHGEYNQRLCSFVRGTSEAREPLEDIAPVCPSALGEKHTSKVQEGMRVVRTWHSMREI